MDQDYITVMMLNATIAPPSSGGSGTGSGPASTGRPMSFFEFGKHLAGLE